MHSILVDPRNPDHLMVAVSTAGVLASTDGGKTWSSRNKGLTMDYLPNPEAEWGHDPHFVTQCAGQPDHVWQQNHCGVFYSADGAASWKKVSSPGDGVHFGFPVAVDAKDGRTAWVVPGKRRHATDNDRRIAIPSGELRTAVRRGSSFARVCLRKTHTMWCFATPSTTMATRSRSEAPPAISTSVRVEGKVGGRWRPTSPRSTASASRDSQIAVH